MISASQSSLPCLMASAMHSRSTSTRTKVRSFRSSIETGATTKPRWSSATTRPSATRRESASRSVEKLTAYISRSASNRSLAPGFSVQLMMSVRIRCSTSAARVSPAALSLSRIRVVLGGCPQHIMGCSPQTRADLRKNQTMSDDWTSIRPGEGALESGAMPAASAPKPAILDRLTARSMGCRVRVERLGKKVACEVNDCLRRSERGARSPDRTHLSLPELHELLADERKISVQVITHIRCGDPYPLAAGIHRNLPHLPPPVR